MSLHFPKPVTASNIGGCRIFSFANADDLINVSYNGDHSTVTDVFLTMGKSFFNGYATYSTLQFEEKISKNASGVSFLAKISGFYPNSSNHALKTFTHLCVLPLVVRITDNNNRTWFVGTKETPLKFTFDKASGRSPSARSGINFEFSGQLLRPSPLII